MTDTERKVIVGGRYRHPDKFNTEYIVEKIIMDATGEEETGTLGEIVIYRQVVAGIYPIDTIYARTVKDFLSQMEYQGKVVNKFELTSK